MNIPLILLGLALGGVVASVAFCLWTMFRRWVTIVRSAPENADEAFMCELDYPDMTGSSDPSDPSGPSGPRDPGRCYCPCCHVRLGLPVPPRGTPKLCDYHARRIRRREPIFA